LKFSDIVIAVASLAVVILFLDFILDQVLIPVIGWDSGGTVVGIISFLLSGLIVGAVFSRKIWEEAGIKNMAKIIVLGAVLLMLFSAATYPSAGDWTTLVKQDYQNANPGQTLTTSQWWSVEEYALTNTITLNVFIGIVASFVGLYLGSMLRKPKKS